MTEPIRIPAPEAIGDIVDGHPPVPITVWYVLEAEPGQTMSTALAQRLVANFTHHRNRIIDVSDGPQLASAASAAQRRHRRHQAGDLASGRGPAALIVAGWPIPDIAAQDYLTGCASRLAVGGCAALVLIGGEFTVHQHLIGAARSAGLTYLQHIVAAHELSDRGGPLGDGGTHLRVHTDVLIFSRSRYEVANVDA